MPAVTMMGQQEAQAEGTQRCLRETRQHHRHPYIVFVSQARCSLNGQAGLRDAQTGDRRMFSGKVTCARLPSAESAQALMAYRA
jgi:hypothetical protein